MEVRRAVGTLLQMFAGPSAGTATHDKIPFFAQVQKYTNSSAARAEAGKNTCYSTSG